jgi:micrococcal nuclease
MAPLLLTNCATEKGEISAHNQMAPVINIVDGDTFDVVLKDGQKLRIRLSGIDTPEFNLKNKKPQEPFAQEAKDFATQHLLNKQVLLLNDSIGQQWDQYRRRVMLVYINGVDFNELLLEAGLAKVAAPRYKHDKTPYYQALEAKAKEAKLGIWSNFTP